MGEIRDSCDDFSTPGGMKMALRRGKKVDGVNGWRSGEILFDDIETYLEATSLKQHAQAA